MATVFTSFLYFLNNVDTIDESVKGTFLLPSILYEKKFLVYYVEQIAYTCIGSLRMGFIIIHYHWGRLLSSLFLQSSKKKNYIFYILANNYYL